MTYDTRRALELLRAGTRQHDTRFSEGQEEAIRAQGPVCDARYRPCGVFGVPHAESVLFAAPASPFGGPGHLERADAVRHGAHPVRQPHPPNVGRRAAGAFRGRVSGDHCGSGALWAVGWRTSTALSAHRWLHWALLLAPEFVRPRDRAGKRDCGSRAARRRPTRGGPSMVGLRPVHLGDDPYARQPLCEAVQVTGGNHASRQATRHWANTCWARCRRRPIGSQAGGVRANAATDTGGGPACLCSTVPMRSASPGRRSGSPSRAAG